MNSRSSNGAPSNLTILSYPCSDLQTQLYFADKVSPGRGEYNAAVAWELSPGVDVDKFTDSLTAVTARHESLRTRFKVINGAVTQVVEAHSLGEWLRRDLTKDTSKALARSISQELETLCQTSFNLESGPTHRVALIKLSDRRQIVCVVMHHIICDERSFEIFFRELMAAYTNDLGSTYPPQFREYCRSREDTPALDRAFWEACLAGHTPLPVRDVLSRIRPEDAVAVQISSPWLISVSDLISLTAKLSCTPFILTLAAFRFLLRRYTGNSDFSVATPVTLRTHPRWEDAIGPFTRVLPIRNKICPTDSIAAAIRRERDAFLEAIEHQEELPSDAHVRLGYDSFNRQILFQWSYSAPLSNFGSFTASRVETPFPGLKTDLALKVRVSNGRMSPMISFSTSQITRRSAERLLDHLHTIITEMITNPAQQMRDVKSIVGEERRVLLEDWSGACRVEKGSSNDTVIDLFGSQVKANAHRFAVICGNAALTYRELDDQSDRLARYLQELGAGRETLVALRMRRSIKMVVALWGVLKAGAAYLPIDADSPPERLNFILGNAGIKLFLSDVRAPGGFTGTDINAVWLDQKWPEIVGLPAGPLDTTVRPGDLAYVIYTSGSTGKPKGVMIEHGSLANYAGDMSRRLQLTTSDVVLAATNICFDISVTELICPVLAGAGIFLTKTFAEMAPGYLATAIRDGGITVIQSTPTFYSQLLSRPEPSGLKDVKTIVVGGEPLSDILARRLRAASNARLCNAYGPTETCVWSTMGEIEPGGPVTAGKPVANTAVYVLDPDLDCQATNIPGDIYIAGTGLARGYRNAAEKTAEHFVRLDKIGVGRAYKTGDTGAWLPTGELVLLGRQDHQVKWNGYRIELEEIDAVFRDHPSVVDAAAILATNGNTQLVLCYIASAPLSSGELVRFGGEQLPPHLLPSSFVELSKMPANASGKTDRHALAKIVLQRQAESTKVKQIAPPQTANEDLLWRLWSEILLTQRFGVDDNFFSLGGQSMGLAQLQSLVSQAIAAEVPFMELFSRPTIRQQADYLDTLILTNEDATG